VPAGMFGVVPGLTGAKKRDCAERVVDFGGYGERKKAKLSAA
jgi:hypothetical protein